MKQEVTKALKRKRRRARYTSINNSSPIKTNAVQRGNHTWWQELTEGQRKVVTTTTLVLGISLVSAVTIYIGSNIVRNQLAKNEESKSFGKDEYTTWAKQLKNAFDNNGWWGTNEALIRSTLIEIPSKESFQKVNNAYRRLFKGESLVRTLTDELKDTEYNEMLAIINSKPLKDKEANSIEVVNDPEGWSIRINSAINYEWLGFGWGTDEEAISAVIREIPTQKAFYETMITYKKKYGTELLADLKGDLDTETYVNHQRTILNKPKY